MSIVKNVSGPYIINTINHDDPIILDSNVVIINGNLQVIGNSTTISSTNTGISDNIITLNNGLGPTTTPSLDAGIAIDRGNSANVSLKWNETAKKWQITNDYTSGSTFYNIVATTTGNTRVVDDASPQLGANLNLAGFSIVDTVSQYLYLDPTNGVKLDGNIYIKKTSGAPAPIGLNNYNIITSSNVGTGGTGLYVTNDEGTTNQELITKSRAVVYAIIF
jgi:hypothetical protein